MVKILTDLPKISVFSGNLSVDLGASACEKTFHPDRPAWPSKTASKTCLGKLGADVSTARPHQGREGGEMGLNEKVRPVGRTLSFIWLRGQDLNL